MPQRQFREDLGLAIKQVQAQNHRSLGQRLSSLGISLVQWNALREIHRNPGISAHALSELTFNSDQAFGTLAGRLVHLNLAQRRAGKGKMIVHHLSPKGIDLLNKGAAIHRVYLKAAFGPLSSQEKTILLRLLRKLLSRNEEVQSQNWVRWGVVRRSSFITGQILHVEKDNPPSA